MDEGVPVRRALVGFALLVAFIVVLLLLVRPAIFTLAPPRDDRAVTVGTQTEVSAATRRVEVVLGRSYGWDGEQGVGDGRVQVGIVAGPTPNGIAVVNAASPVEDDCPVEITADRLVDCGDRAWTFGGDPIASGDPPLERFPYRIENGTVVVDFTRTIDE